MKKLAAIIASIITLSIPMVAFAQLNFNPQGGTGLNTAAAGDMFYAATVNPIRLTKLTIGGAGTCITSNGLIPLWSTCASATGGQTWEINIFGALAPTTTIGIQVTASSTIGNGTGAGGLTINGNATTTGIIKAGNGTASLPAFSFIGDPNTGIYTSGGDELIFVTGGTDNRLKINNSGNVGIADSNPTLKLSVVGSARVTGNLYASSTLLVGNTVTTSYYIATSTVASQLPYASTTAFTVSGSLYNTSLSDGCLQSATGLITSTGVACGSGGGTTYGTSTATTTGILSSSNWNSFWNGLFPRRSGSYNDNATTSTLYSIATTTYQFDDFSGYFGRRWVHSSNGSQSISNNVLSVTTPASSDTISTRTLWSNILNGFDTLVFEVNFNGYTFLTAGDTPRIGFSQGAAKWILLQNFATNGVDGWQTIRVPLAYLSTVGDGTPTTPGTGTVLDPTATVNNMQLRVYDTVAGRTLSIRNIKLEDSTHTLIEDFTQPDLISQSKPGNAAWKIQSLDFMKITKDNLTSQYTRAKMDSVLQTVGPLNITHVAVSTPYDGGLTYATSSGILYAKQWGMAIRAAGYNVFWRAHPNNWEGDYGLAKNVDIPLGTAAGIANGSDTTSRLYSIYRYIIDNPDQYAPGDIFTPMAEPENGGIDTVYDLPPNQFSSYNEFRTWLRDAITVSNMAFDRIGLKGRIHIGYYGHSGFTVWGGTSSGGGLDDRTMDAEGIVATDHYPNPISDLTTDLTTYEGRYGVFPLFIGEWGTLNETSTTTRQDAIHTYLGILKSKGYIQGLNYWSYTGGANEDLLDNGLHPEGGYAALQIEWNNNAPTSVASHLQTNIKGVQVDISSSSPPLAGQVLVAATSTRAVWTTLFSYLFPSNATTTPLTFASSTNEGRFLSGNFLATSTATSTFNGGIDAARICITGTTQCLRTITNGTVTSVGLSSSNSTLTIGSTPVTTSGTITADLNLANPNIWTGLQTFNSASSTSFSILNSLSIGRTASTTIVGNLGTSTFSSFISAVSASTTATSTMSGINLPYGGCFAIAGVCINLKDGTVTSIATNAGLTGGTITTTGTIGLDVTSILNGTLLQYNGTRLAATGTPALTAGYFIATSTLATSTFAGDVTIGSGAVSFSINQRGHMYASSTAPAVSSGAVDGTDISGVVYGCSSACTVTFSQTYVRPPACLVTPYTGSVLNVISYTVSTSALVVTETGLGTFAYFCSGQ